MCYFSFCVFLCNFTEKQPQRHREHRVIRIQDNFNFLSVLFSVFSQCFSVCYSFCAFLCNFVANFLIINFLVLFRSLWQYSINSLFLSFSLLIHLLFFGVFHTAFQYLSERNFEVRI